METLHRWMSCHRPKKALQLWDISTGKLIEEINWDPLRPPASSRVLSAQFEKTERGLLAACGTSKNELRLFNKSSTESYKFPTGVANIPSICATVDLGGKENLVAIGCCDGICRMFEIVEKAKREVEKTSDPFK